MEQNKWIAVGSGVVPKSREIVWVALENDEVKLASYSYFYNQFWGTETSCIYKPLKNVVAWMRAAPLPPKATELYTPDPFDPY